MQTLLDLIERFEELGSREALIGFNDFRTRKLSYKESFEGIARFAKFLEVSALHKGDRVLIWGENCPEWVMAFWGCIARGLPVIPVDYRFSIDLVLRICRESQPALLVHGSEVDAAGIPLPKFSFDAMRDLPSASRLSVTAIDPDDVVEVVYTSGTTAEPKGITHRHRNIVANLEPFKLEIEKYAKWARPFQPIRILDLLPLSHMFGQALGLFIPVLLGGSAAFTGELNPATIIASVRRHRISVLVSVPHVIQNLRNEIERRFTLPPSPSGRGLKIVAKRWWRYRKVHSAFGWKFWCVVSGGAFVAPELEAFWNRVGIAFVQGYGLTETSPVVAVNHPLRARQGSLGKPVKGQEVRIASDGEILVRGASVVGAVDAEGWFHTGDIGEVDNDGRLYYRGRRKDVIVTADGMNVYPDDVEAVLNALPEVRSSVVVSVNDEVHAVMILRDKHASAKEVIAEANRRLEPYQRVRGWTVWPAEDFPRTQSTMKVKRGDVAAQISGGVATAPPIPLVEKDVSAMSSLERVDLLAALEQRYGVELDEVAFARMGSNEELKEWISSQTQQSEASSKDDRGLWAASRPIRLFGNALQRVIALPLFRHYLPLSVYGLENLMQLQPPVIFVANHASHLDTPAIFAALPAPWRRRLAPAARQEQFRGFFDFRHSTSKEILGGTLQYVLAGLLFNVYPLPQTMAGVRRALRKTGELVSRGYCPLIFPEGHRTLDGRMHAFQPGVGLMAVRLRIPVVPIYLKGLYEVYSAHDSWPKAGPVAVYVGPPLEFAAHTDYADAAAKIEQAVNGLAADYTDDAD
jgi:long-chain acyl-CoA synthetase